MTDNWINLIDLNMNCDLSVIIFHKISIFLSKGCNQKFDEANFKRQQSLYLSKSTRNIYAIKNDQVKISCQNRLYFDFLPHLVNIKWMFRGNDLSRVKK